MTQKFLTCEQIQRLIDCGADVVVTNGNYTISDVIDLLPKEVDGDRITLKIGVSGNWHVTYDNIWGTYDKDLLEACVKMYEHLHKFHLIP